MATGVGSGIEDEVVASCINEVEEKNDISVHLKLSSLPHGCTVDDISEYFDTVLQFVDAQIQVKDVTILGNDSARVEVIGKQQDVESIFLQRKQKFKRQLIDISILDSTTSNDKSTSIADHSDESFSIADHDKSSSIADHDKSFSITDHDKSSSIADHDKSFSITDHDKSSSIADHSDESFSIADHDKSSQVPNPFSSLPDNNIPNVVEVTGENLDEDGLSCYFEGERSGGNREKTVESIETISSNVMHVKFSSIEDAAVVVNHKQHVYLKKPITVQYVVAPPPIQYMKDQLLIKNIPEGVDKEFLLTFIESRCSELDSDANFSIDFRSNCALLKLSRDYSNDELTKMIKKLTTRKVKKMQFLTVEQVQVTCSLVISNITKKIFLTKDGLEMYFDNPRSGSQPGAVTNIQLSKRQNKVTITFTDSSVVSQVLKQKHEKLGPNVMMAPYTVLDYMNETKSIVSQNDSDSTSTSSTNDAKEEANKFHKKKKNRKKKKGTKRKKSESDDDSILPKKKAPSPPVCLPVDPLLAKYLKAKPQLTDGITKEFQVTITIDDVSNVIAVTHTISSPPEWSQKSDEMLKSLLVNSLTKVSIPVSPEIANTVYPMITKVCSEEKLQYTFGKGNDQVTIAGHIDAVSKLQDEITEISSRLKKSDSVSINEEDYIFLKSLGSPIVKLKHPNVEFHFNDSNHSVTLVGSIRDVDELKLKLKEYLIHSKVHVNVSPLAISFLQSTAGRSIIQNLSQSFKLIPYYCNDSFMLLSTHELASQAETVASKIVNEISTYNIPLPQSFHSAVNSSLLESFQDDLKNNYHFHVAVTEHQLTIVSSTGMIKDVKDAFTTFINEKCSVTKVINLNNKGVWRLFNSKMEKSWSDIVNDMEERKVTIESQSKPTAQNPSITLKGEICNVEAVAEKILALQSSVKMSKVSISRPGIRQFFNSENGQLILRGVENEAKVCIVLEEIKEQNDAPTFTAPNPNFSRVCFGSTPELKVINVFVGDITEFNKAEVIVNAANEDLKHFGGVALAIAKKGGPQIQEESDEYIASHGKVSTGNAVMFTNTGNLPPSYKAIVHAVGPRWTSRESDDRKIALLKKAILQSLTKAKGCSSIAIPAVSSGIYGFPVNICADALLQAVISFSKKYPKSLLNEFNFVIFENNVDAFVEATQKYVKNVRLQSPDKDTLTPPISNTNKSTPHQDNEVQSKRRRRRQNTSTRSVANIDKTILHKSIKITKGSILDHQEEALVNPTDPQFGFGGFVAQLLSKSAGPGLLEEVETIKKPIAVGDIITTNGYNLKSKHVIHVVLPQYNSTTSEQVLRETVQKCLAECDRLKIKSISFPSIGAGNLKYPESIVASALIEEAVSYLEKHQQTSLQLVHFVLFEQKVYDAFQKCYSSINSPTVSKFQPAAIATPVQQQKFESQHKQQSTNSQLPVHSFSLPNGLQLNLIHGDISCDDSDVIVNTTNENLQLVGTGVAGALLKRGGPELQEACNAEVAKGNKATKGNVVVTRATGSLRCKQIFHIAFHNKEQDHFIRTIHACLDKAERLKCQSIAFPAVGTGVHGYPPSSASKAIVEALKKFTKKRPKFVKTIRIIVFQKDIYQEFVDAFKTIGESSGGIMSYLYSGITGIKAGIKSLLGVNDHEYEQSSENEEQINDDFRQVHSTRMSLDSDEIVFCIYGETDNLVQTASKRLRKTIEEQFISEEITDISISSITDSTVKEFKALASTHIVEIDVDRDPALHYIKLFGSVQNVLLVKDKIRDKMSTFNCEQAIKSAADVLYKTVNWIRQTSNEEEEDYGEDLNYEIEQHYRNKQPTFHCKEEEFIINFEKMEEMDIKTGKNAKVRRVDLSKESKPDNWDPMPIDSKGNEKQVHCVSLTAGCPEYNHVEIHFNKTMQKGTSYNQIISIQRIQNPALYQQYVVKRKQMDKLNPKGHENERWLWHGTNVEALEHINTRGFDRGLAGVHAIVYGKGVYFARDAEYSNRSTYAQPDANGHKHMYFSQVLTGEYTVGNDKMKVPPAKNPQINKSVYFDSTVDNQANPAIFVVYLDCQYYPTYLISYK